METPMRSVQLAATVADEFKKKTKKWYEQFKCLPKGIDFPLRKTNCFNNAFIQTT